MGTPKNPPAVHGTAGGSRSSASATRYHAAGRTPFFQRPYGSDGAGRTLAPQTNATARGRRSSSTPRLTTIPTTSRPSSQGSNPLSRSIHTRPSYELKHGRPRRRARTGMQTPYRPHTISHLRPSQGLTRETPASATRERINCRPPGVSEGHGFGQRKGLAILVRGRAGTGRRSGPRRGPAPVAGQLQHPEDLAVHGL